MAIRQPGSGEVMAPRSQRRKARRRQEMKQVFRRAQIEACEPRNLMAVTPQLIAIIPNAGDLLVEGQVRNEAPREFILRFDDGQILDEVSARNGGVIITGAGGDGVFGNANDVNMTPDPISKNGFIGLGDRPNEIVVRFSDHLPDDRYQIQVTSALVNTDQLPAAGRVVSFELDLGPRVVAVVPQPIRRVGSALQQARNEIEVYFNNDDLNVGSAQNPNFYQLIRTRSTADNLDDGPAITPVSAVYDAVQNKVRLIFAQDLAGLDTTNATYRLRIGNRYSEPLAPLVRTEQQTGEAASTFTGAMNVNAQVGKPALDNQTIIVQGQILQVDPYLLELPGSNDEPGHREMPPLVDAPHLGAGDSALGVTTQYYNFGDVLGFDLASGAPYPNFITPAQKQRAREVFDYYARYLGVQFIESTDQGWIIGTGDLRAVDPGAVTGPGGVIGIAGGGIAVMDSAEDWGSSETGGGWFGTAMHEIGHLLGLGHTYDLPPGTIQGSDSSLGGGNDPSYPGDHDIVHGRHLHRPESTDVDVYRFSLDKMGMFSAATVGERLSDSSNLDSALWLFNSSGELIARNDDYFSEDSFVELELQPGDYFVAVTSTGTSEINPDIPHSGFGGTSEGRYELRLNFKPSPERNPTALSGIVDNDLAPTLLDGDADGKPGGEYNFWFTVAAAANTLIVDKSAPVGGNGTLASPFNNIAAAFNAANQRNIDGNTSNDVRVVRIVGNGGADNNVATQSDNLAYEIGFNALGQPLADGSTMQVPKGVTVMVDAGALFRLRRANIDVGSKAQGVDQSEGHLQVLGIPTQRVIFTSYNTRPAQPDAPRAGDWGGIVFRNELDLDAIQSGAVRRVLEEEGIFINYVNHADISFGGGDLLVNGLQDQFSPITLNEARPALSFNLIHDSASAAIGADPNSFKEDLFTEVGRDFVRGQVRANAGVLTLVGGTWPDTAAGRQITIAGATFDVVARLNATQIRINNPAVNFTVPSDFVLSARDFTADYRRIGPEIYDNDLVNNTINGLFLQVDTLSGQILDRLEVSARFDDIDIAHVLSENLVIAGTPGGAIVQLGGTRQQARFDGRLAIDPGIVLKIDHARIETEIGAELIAEGRENNRVVFTSLLDDRYGGRGTFITAKADLGPFSTGLISVLDGVVTLVGSVWPAWAEGATLTINNVPYTVISRDSDTQLTINNTTIVFNNVPFVLSETARPAPGDWGGLYFGPVSHGSLDHALITFAGGTTSVEGGFASFSPVEIQQADVRLTNSVLENNAGGSGAGRGVGRFDNDTTIIYVRAAQPIIVNNIIRNNDTGDDAAAISINVNAVNSDAVHDTGRSTGALGRTGNFLGNQGALVRGNRLDRNGINGMRVRGSTLTTQSVWDDTDIVHVVTDEIVIPNHHTFSGVRLQSSPTESLVVKLRGPTAGFTANGSPLDIDDRLGGSFQVVGTPGHPVVMTSLLDSTVGAGVDPQGRPQNATFGSARAPLSQVSQMDIDFRASPAMTANAAAMAAFSRAIQLWEAVLDDPIDVVFDVDFTAIAGGVLGLGSPVMDIRSYDVVRQLMIADAGPTEAIVGELPTFTQLQVTVPNPNVVVSPTMAVARANLLALGLDPAQLIVQPSTYDPTTPIDGTLTFNSGVNFDYNPSDGITPGAQDFVATAVHEIGHALGFISAVDDVVAGLTNIELNTLDLFRVAPGAGAIDFTNTPRLLDPAAADHVFYDGGEFNRAGITVAPRIVGDIPMSRGAATDTFSASHWRDDAQLGVTGEIGIMDPTLAGGLISRITSADGRAFDLIGYDVVSRGTAGEWRSIKLERYSNDRNVAALAESEQQTDRNDTPQAAQTLGNLAATANRPGTDPTLLGPGERGGDDNRRLGFQVQGAIATPGDVDVYTFEGRGGTEVWIDIDRTTHALDTVIELIDAAGNVLARSNDSGAADQTGSAGTRVYPLQRDIFNGRDLYTTNPRDAGLRLVLPGPTNIPNDYYIRIRSNIKPGDSLDDPAKLHEGQTSGVYQLQVRLRELDEVPGSSVRGADIRFATNGIEVLGTPGHSPLLGEAFETTAVHDTQLTAQFIGNVLRQDRGALSLGGFLDDFNEVDWYRLEVDWQAIQDIPTPGVMDHDNTASIIFDFDYGDGASRPDTNFAVFDDTGTLIYVARSSNITDDQSAPGSGSDVTDLSRASFGKFDPYLGPIHLRENDGKTYFVAVTPDSNLPEVLKNPRVRIEPILAQDRLIDDRVGSSWTPGLPGRPAPQLLFPDLNAHADEFQLGDVVLYVHNGDRLWTVDPLTGMIDSDIGRIIPFNEGLGDLATRTDGRLNGISLGTTPGSTLEISTDNAAFNAVGDDAIANDPRYQAFTIRDIGGGRRISYFASEDGRLFAFNADTGTTDDNLTGADNEPPLTLSIGMADFTEVVTGLAYLNGTLYGVTEDGSFISIDLGNLGMDPPPDPAPQIVRAQVTVISTPTDPATMNPIPFSGLSLGPQRAEGGAYADRLFASDSDGMIWSLDEMGVLQPVFVDGKLSVDTQLPGLSGLAFSTLDYNLWHVTDRREGDDGHGLDPTPDGVRSRLNRIEGGNSFWFGLERDRGQPAATLFDTNSSVFGTYNLPGGAHGSLTSAIFSLAGYARGDAPTFYFNYWAQKDALLDSFRVYISNDGAAWTLLDQTTVPQRFEGINPFTDNLVADSQWRQSRLDLSSFAGLETLRIRFDFTTLGSRDVGVPNFGGTPLSVVEGSKLLDGDSFTLADAVTGTPTVFELDMGFSLRIPNGAQISIQDGDTFTVNTTVFEFDRAGDGVSGTNVPIVVTGTETPDDLTQAIEDAINGENIAGVTVNRAPTRLNLSGATDVQQTGTALIIEGDAPGTLIDPTAVPVVLHAAMTRDEVADAVADQLDEHYAVTVNMTSNDPNIFTAVKREGEGLYVIGKTVLNPGPFPVPIFAPQLPGDYLIANPRDRAGQGRDNNFEGVYIDDFVIGFAERGEIVSAAPADATYVDENIKPAGQVLEGAYQFEVRRGFEYGNATFSTQNPYILDMTRGFAANDRFADGLSIVAPEPGTILPGTTFTIDDGLNIRTFEFNLTGTPSSIAPGNVSVNIPFAQTATDVALAISQAVNSDPILMSTASFDYTSTFFGETSPNVYLARVANFSSDTLAPTIWDADALSLFGDSNIFRDQGQLLIHGNTISNSLELGIRVDAGARDPNSDLPHPGAVRNLIDFNTQRLVTSVSIANNVIANSGTGGILFSGDPGTNPPGAVPVGRIYSNSIYGGDTPVGVGIRVSENASPTLLNNVVANNVTGIVVDATSASTQIGSTVYHRNATNITGAGPGALATIVAPTEEIFVDPENDNFYPISGSKLIDSARDTLDDRVQMTSIQNPLGIPPSPILTPERDMLGQERVDDSTVSNTGLGQNPFKDRGAIERADLAGPTALLFDPRDDDDLGRDLERTRPNTVRLGAQFVTNFAVQLVDGVLPADPALGVGVDDSTVTATQFTVTRDGVVLTEGVDYFFSYDSLNNIARFTPAEGLWTPEHTYVIQLNNDPLLGIKDLAGNVLKPNDVNGLTQFTIEIESVDFGDAPDDTTRTYPTLFVDENSQPGAHHVISPGFQLGATVTAETDGQPTVNADTDNGDDGVTFQKGFVPGEATPVRVNVVRTGLAPQATALLNAWVDFNGDGDWDDAGEQVFTNQVVVGGNNDLVINVPATATHGLSYARFRLSTDQNLSSSGAASNGEVEDYRLDIVPLVKYELQLNYANSSKELYRDAFGRYFVSPNLQFTAEVYVDDQRTVNAAGVRQAFADLVYDNDLIDWNAGSLTFGPSYSSGQTGAIDEPNQLVDEAGGIAPIQTGGTRQLLFRVTGTVKSTAARDQTFGLSLNQADASPSHDTLLFNSPNPVVASYDSETIVVHPNPWQNAFHRMDVNADGKITGLDALIIINRLNTQGSGPLPVPPMAPTLPAPFYDVNGDNNVTPLDALIIINLLNNGGGGIITGPASGGESTPVTFAAASSETAAAPAVGKFATSDGVPLASSFDVTGVAISVAGSGSTAVAPAIERAIAIQTAETAAGAMALADVIGELYSEESGDTTSNSVRVAQSAPAVAELAESLADDGYVFTGSAAGALDTLAVTKQKTNDLDELLTALGFGDYE